MNKLWQDYQRFRDRFQEAMDPRLYPIEHLDGLIWSGRASLLAVEDAAIVYGMKVYPTGAKDVEGVVAAGDMEVIVGKLIPKAEMWGQALGCEGAVIESRPGWARVLKELGYETHQVSVRKVF